jgi:hypothetical protein
MYNEGGVKLSKSQVLLRFCSSGLRDNTVRRFKMCRNGTFLKLNTSTKEIVSYHAATHRIMNCRTETCLQMLLDINRITLYPNSPHRKRMYGNWPSNLSV